MTTRACSRCRSAMEPGFTTARGLTGGALDDSGPAQILFVVPATQTSANPIKAFAQGVREGPAARRYRISGWRCPGCGMLELATDGDPV